MNNKNCIKQNLLGQILILFRQENLRRKFEKKTVTSIKTPISQYGSHYGHWILLAQYHSTKYQDDTMDSIVFIENKYYSQ